MATSFAIAQISFIDILSDPPFFQLHNGSIAFADVDGDVDLDLMGRVVLEEKTIRIHENHVLEIELPKLAGGQYFVSIRHGKQKTTKGYVVE